MRVIESAAGYEIRCHACNVSYPPETKQCMHCGGRLGRGQLDLDKLERGSIDDVPEQAPRRGLLRTGLGSMWILLALTATCYRVCTG